MKKVRFEKKKYTYLDSLRFSIISSPVCTILYLILSLAVAILPTYQVIINARFIDNALGLIDGSATKRTVYISLAIVIGIIAYQWLVEPIKAYLANKIEMDMRVSLKGAHVEKCSKIEFKYVENTDSMDLMNRVADTMEHKFIDGFTNVVNLISLFMTIAGLLIVLITQIAWVALIVIAVAIPLLYLSFISGKATYEANKEITKYQRKYKYLTTVMTGRENVDERTVFEYNEKLNDKWFEQYEISRKMETRTRAKWFVKLKSGSMITAFLCTFIAAMLINPVATGIITIGMFFSLINATFDLVHTMSWSLTRLIEAVSTHIEYLKEITKFATFEQYDNADAVPEGGIEFKSLEFRNVTFKYPGTETYILMGHSMGAWTAFEIAQRFQLKGISPRLLVLSSNVPAKYYNDRVSIDAGDEVVQAQLLERNHELKQFFEDEMLKQTFYPLLKADYIAIDDYLKKDEGMKVTCTVLGLIADGDRFDEATMGKWKEYVDGVYLQKIIKGNHFAFYKEHEYVRQLIENSIC